MSRKCLQYIIDLGFSLGSNTTSNVPLNLSFGSTTTVTTASASPFSLGTTLNAKTTVAATGTQLTLGTATNVTTSSAPGKFKFNFEIVHHDISCSKFIFLFLVKLTINDKIRTTVL